MATPLTLAEYAGKLPGKLAAGKRLNEEVTLRCPECGFDHLHLCAQAVSVDPGGSTNCRGEIICLPGWCENGHRFTLCFGQHKGRTESWAEERSGALLHGSLPVTRRTCPPPESTRQHPATRPATVDKFNRLTRNDEWQVGARYRWTKVHESRLVRSVRRACEVTFLGWHHTGRRELVGHATLLYADGSKVVFSPVCWRNRWVLIAPNPEPLPPIEDLAQLLAGNAPGEPSGCPGVVIDAARHTVTLHYDGAYEIDLDTIPDEAALLRWLLHLCEKNWMDTARLHEVATAIGTYKGFRLSGLL